MAAEKRSDGLQEYRRKRDFAQTREPAGGPPAKAPRGQAGQALSFVVQKHAARALHYDFRLELDGTLKSWAVPKGPSLDPQDKRMAVQVEDHPLAYAGFEGVIPPGQYGAGTVIVWDRGVWLPQGDPRAAYAAGKLKFELRGEKLQGHWTLVRMHGRASERQPPWLLIKERDDDARPAADYSIVEALPDSVLGKAATPAVKRKKTAKKAKQDALPLSLAPQLATLVEAAPREAGWQWELKFDGYRLLARVEGEDVRLFTRNGHDWTAKLKPLARAITRLQLGTAWLDGEIVVQDKEGAPDFQALQNSLEAARSGDILYYLFDLMFHAGRDLRETPLAERRAALRELLREAAPPLRFSEDFAVAPEHLLHTACQLRMEGLIGKRADGRYQSRRSSDWIKLKCTQRQEFVIVGYTDPKGSRQGLGALLLAVHDEAGALRYAGNVGSGFGNTALRELAQRLQELAQAKPTLNPPPPDQRGVHWVRPKLVAEISFSEWTREGRVRHAVFHGLRGDKPAAAITRERPQQPAPAGKRAAAAAPARAALPAGLRLSHPTRVIDASSGISKLELAEYYAAAAARMLPHLKQRPVSLVRGPDGVGGELFFQKHGDTLKIPGLKQLDPKLDPGHAPLLEIDSARALLGAVQMNVLELHTWNGRSDAIEQPDRMFFDLDPGEGVAWPQIQEAASLLRALLQELQLQAFLKTSGGKGLHLLVPLRRGPGWAEVKGLSRAIVAHLAATLPQRFVVKSGPRNRVGKIFIDYLRNGRGATTACAWSARARPGIGISVPVAWDELDALTSGAHWHLRNIGERLALKSDPWAEMKAVAGRQGLATAMRVLDFVPSAR
ncbi:DNA ligase D [Roseateles violae]|uniref:DNA ligase (ATP) n=1 Tax=Roseateles violae TaxID=3058042 RepID=A0ABT8DLT4_9BURK|nr:DNA ligase D [Pelomonas sp. PFR6]MDN3919360.1 DNA ligase D [Pelomonas sp. PFR6]